MGQSGATQRFLGALFEAGAVGGLTDAELLERFVARSPSTAELAFAVLVERHGPLVHRVCRGILRDEHAAEDAFQSTFLVLVKKASSLRVCTSLAPWLHAVAYRVACEARANAARRFKHERRVAELATEAQCTGSDQREELERRLQGEIARLTEVHRRAIVLCDLEGLTHEQAAQVLGTPVGTVKSRLARGRERLRERLSRPGLELSGSVLSGALERGASPTDVSTLVDRTARLAMKVAESDGLIAGTVPASVANLVQGVLNSMFRSRLKSGGAAIGTAAAIAIGIGIIARGLLAQAEPVRRLVAARPMATSIDIGVRDLTAGTGLVRSVAFSRDGRFLVATTTPADGDNKQPGEIRMWDAQGGNPRPPVKLEGDPFAMAVAPDGQTMAVAIAREPNGDRRFLMRVLKLPSGETIKEWPLEKGIDVWALSFAPGGRALVGGIGGLREGKFFGEVRFWDPASGEERPALTGHANPVMSLAYSHDGRTLASASGTYGALVGEVRLWEVASGRLLRTMTETTPAAAAIVSVAFSADDKTVASGGTIWREGNEVSGLVSLWDVATGDKKRTLPAFPSYVHAVAFAPKGSLLATGSIGRDGDGQVVLWDSKTGKAIRTLPPTKNVQPVSAVKCLEFDPAGRTLAAGGASGMLRLWTVDIRD
jgi:RNA polymerase sigma factor (sigma-70 family)